MQQGELSMVCVGLSERDLLQWHDVTRKILGGQAKFLGGSGSPGSAPTSISKNGSGDRTLTKTLWLLYADISLPKLV